MGWVVWSGSLLRNVYDYDWWELAMQAERQAYCFIAAPVWVALTSRHEPYDTDTAFMDR